MDMVTNVNMPCVSVDTMVQMLSSAYIKLIENNLPMKNFPSVMLWGAPGVGKSQGVRAIGKEIEKRTGKRTVITDVRLLLFNPIDLRGIPVASEDKTLAIWLKPKIFQMDPSEDVINILFLDEISAAPQSVQAAAYQITLDRIVGEHALPENCIVISAGNRLTDKSVSVKMPKALANRLLHLDIQGEFESWKNWAVKSGVNDKVTSYLSFHHDRLFGFDSKSEELAFPTPRSWEMVSHILNDIDDDVESVFSLIAGLVGFSTALEFKIWCDVYKELPTMESIFQGTATTVPKRSDALYALVFAMHAYAKHVKEDFTKMDASISYARKMPADFSVLLMENYKTLDDGYEEKLKKLPEYRKYLMDRGVLLNGRF